eukprot:superscaffoldBa00002242_g13628
MFGQSLLLYLDDIIVFSSSVGEHLSRLDLVLNHLRQEGLKVKLEKCSFFKKEVQYLGHHISEKGVSTDPGKISAVANWPHPTTISELRSFLGFASYYQRLVEGFSKLAAPLHHLLAELSGGKTCKGRGALLGQDWSESCQRSFQELKARTPRGIIPWACSTPVASPSEPAAASPMVSPSVPAAAPPVALPSELPSLPACSPTTRAARHHLVALPSDFCHLSCTPVAFQNGFSFWPCPPVAGLRPFSVPLFSPQAVHLGLLALSLLRPWGVPLNFLTLPLFGPRVFHLNFCSAPVQSPVCLGLLAPPLSGFRLPI